MARLERFAPVLLSTILLTGCNFYLGQPKSVKGPIKFPYADGYLDTKTGSAGARATFGWVFGVDSEVELGDHASAGFIFMGRPTGISAYNTGGAHFVSPLVSADYYKGIITIK